MTDPIEPSNKQEIEAAAPHLATASQLSLSLFEDMISQGLSIQHSPKDIGFQRNNLFLELTALNMTSQRFLDAAYFIVAQDRSGANVFDVELTYFRWLMRFDSRNFKYLRQVIQDCQKSVIAVSDTPPDKEVTEHGKWVSVQLLGTAGISNGRIVFEVPNQLVRNIKEPGPSHWLSLRIAAAFTLIYARAIYMQVLLHVAEGQTGWIPVDELRLWPGEKAASKAAYKYFKRDYLDPAIRQINEVSDIEISFETRGTTPRSRKIDQIRFHLKKKEGKIFALESLKEAQEIYRVLTEEFRLSSRAINEISEHRDVWTDEWIANAIEFTRYRLRTGQIKRNPAGYLMTALRQNLALSPAEKQMISIQEDSTPASSTAMLPFEDASAAIKAPAKNKKAPKPETQNVLMTQSQAQAEAALQNERELRIATGYERYNKLDKTAAKNMQEEFLLSSEAFILLRRLKLANHAVDEATLFGNELLADSLYLFVYRKTSEPHV
ncbi:RepB family plasmid replication initiator protein [Chromobacterium amazonense]|uniref:RepB family plasmid replication initiator protein n=1 Tax=Chromobacterium amazonense TaxID=1382803 RepID=UPI000D036002|nr:RepB family plasmid replication initiator protein [Chromobacterium amazonense]